ncbi:MAG: M16 family metallopeptidase [Mycobacteriales bacterium]
MSAPVYEVLEERLDNGLRVLVNPDATAPVVAVNLWYDVGSRHEQPGRTGLAHLFEHLMFEGSANVARNEHHRLVTDVGGTLNATTWCDRTNYFETVPSQHAELMLWLEADRMGRLTLTQETLDNQRAVVQNERRQRYDNQPYGTWMERVHAAVFPPEHPYHHSTIGSMSDLEAASLADVQEFYRSFYAPDNAVLTVVGDLAVAQVFDMAERHFGELDRRSAPLAQGPDAALHPLIGSERREECRERVPAPRVFLAYRVAPFGSIEFDAVSLLAGVLGEGRGSRLYRELVLERGLAQPGDGAMMYTMGFVAGGSLLVADLLARDGVSAAELEAGYEQVLAELAEEGVDQQELDRARALALSEWLGHVGSLDGRADAFSQFATLFGDPQLVNDVPNRLLAVTVDDVAEALRERLRPDNRYVLTFLPEQA